MSSEEVRVVSETGGEKGSKPAQLGAIDPLALLVLAEVAGFGAQKYDSFNYLKGYDWSLSFNAMQRHALAFWNGEDTDPESGLPHMAHVAWHGLCMTSFLQRGLGKDTRYKQPEPEKEKWVMGFDGSTSSEATMTFTLGDVNSEIIHTVFGKGVTFAKVEEPVESSDELTAEQLDALPVGTDVVDDDTDYWRKREAGNWEHLRDSDGGSGYWGIFTTQDLLDHEPVRLAT